VSFSCSSNKSQIAQTEDKFQIINPIAKDTLIVADYVAEIHSIQNVEIRSRVRGFIEQIHVDEGTSVQTGQVIFTLSAQEFREDLLKANAQLKNALAELKIAEVERNNTKVLADKNIVSASELAMANAKMEAIQARIEEAKSAVASAQINLAFTQVKAPFSGTINRHPLKTGSLVEEGNLLTSISNNQEVFAYFKVSEKEYFDFIKQGKLNNSQKVQLVLANNELHSAEGVIETAENEIDRSTGNIAFRARFANPNQLIKHGASGKVRVNLPLKNALLVPHKSTFEIQEDIYVYALDAKNTAQLRKIKVKQSIPNFYVVESGLSPQDKIIYEGIQRVKAGDKILAENKGSKSINSPIAQK
jgi:membrane fusion protein (multidrug efflux system)